MAYSEIRLGVFFLGWGGGRLVAIKSKRERRQFFEFLECVAPHPPSSFFILFFFLLFLTNSDSPIRKSVVDEKTAHEIKSENDD